MARKKRKYVAAPGAGYNSKDATLIGIELEKLGQSITPGAVVEVARPVSAPLHPFFEWDNAVAAEKYRLFQARNIVNHLQVVVVNSAGESENIKAYFSQQVEGEDEDGEPNAERRYLHISLVESTPVAAQNSVSMAKAELVAWKCRHAQYRRHFAEVIAAIEKLK